MVILYSCVNTFLLLLATAFVTIQGFRSSPADRDTTVLGLRFSDDDAALNNKRDTGKNMMWIGPRLGRRKRSEDEAAMNLAEKNVGTILDILQESPWTIVALKDAFRSAGGKRRTVNFIPRLGRDSDEEYSDPPTDASFVKSGSRTGSQIVGPFGGGNNFTPRLGRFAALYNKEH